jgi:hypothetical protein
VGCEGGDNGDTAECVCNHIGEPLNKQIIPRENNNESIVV